DSTVVLFAGKFIALKRPLDFIRAVAGAPVAGLMAGDGPLRGECEALARTLGANIRFTGFLNQREIAGAYSAADALVLPSDQETWGMVVNEAMSCGLPCIVSDSVGCGPDLIEPSKTGFIFPTGNTGALAEIFKGVAR